MKILTWNIYMLPLLVPRGGKNKRAAGIVEELSKEHFDIILFQEAFLPSSRDIIWAGLKHLYPYQYGPANNTDHIKSSSGLWILSKTELQLLHTIQFEQHAGWDSLVRKGAMLLQGNWNGQLFQLVNTHLQAGPGQQPIRLQQLHQLKNDLLLRYTEPGVPQIIGGDMNISLKRRTDYSDMLKYLNAENGNISGTETLSYDGINNLIARWIGPLRKINFDYILVRSNGFTFQSIHRRLSILKHEGHNLSDHYGLAAEILF